MSPKSKLLMMAFIALLPIFAIGSIEGISVWSGKQRLKRLCENRHLPTILNPREWQSWSHKVRSISGPEGADDPSQREKLFELARKEGVSLRWLSGSPYKFPFDGVWGQRFELMKNGAPLASISEYIVRDTGPISRAILGNGVGSMHRCNKNAEEILYFDLISHEFIATGNLQIEEGQWMGDVI